MTTEPTDAELQALWVACDHPLPQNFARAVLAKWGTQSAVAGNHPYAIQWDAELGRTAMRFVDRAGDVHPGIDDAETICAEFHAAMSAVIERMPHVQRMSPTPQPTHAPDFYTACAWHEGGGLGGWIALPGYSNETEHGVKHLVLEAARKEGYKGTAAGRLLELGWEIRPVYLNSQPTQAHAGAVPLTREQVKAICLESGYETATLQERADFINGIRHAERRHGIKGGQHG